MQVSENKEPNSTVTRINAYDPDLQGKLTFEVRGVAPGSDFFGIKQDTGEIYVIKPLNTESTTTYTVSITILCLIAESQTQRCVMHINPAIKIWKEFSCHFTPTST